jgi:hypothetical protein
LTAARSGPSWIDEAFLWTAASLAVLAVSAAAPAPSVWMSSLQVPPATRAPSPPPPRTPTPAAAPAPLISFAEPTPGYPVISPFGLRQLPWEEHGRLHQGVDIAAPSGTPVLAAADGVVVRTGVDGGYGRFVELRHVDGMTSLYGHLRAIGVRPGAAVKVGEAVGQIGSTGSSTGSHLHFEIHDRRGRPLNPELFLGRAFYSEAELPIRAALRTPRRVRLAYVSFIPISKRDEMAEREAERAAAEAEAAAARAARRQARAGQNAVRLALLARMQPPAQAQPASPAAAPPLRQVPDRAVPTAVPAQGEGAGRVHVRLASDGLF